jgi:hypothetical protein
MVINQDCMHEEIKNGLNLKNSSCHTVQNLLSSLLLSTNVKIKIIILPVVLYGCEILSLTLREKHRLSVSEDRALRRIFGPKENEVMEECK